MATTNYTISGTGISLQDQWGTPAGNQSLALVQWELGYDPAQHLFSEWQLNPIMVSWTGNYQKSPNKWFSTVPMNTNFDSPIYLWVQLNTGGGQSGLFQITDVLTLPGGTVDINIAKANIRSVVGDRINNTLRTEDIGIWTPTAVPEASYYGFGIGLLALAGVLLHKLTR